jgi:hypothetical protein
MYLLNRILPLENEETCVFLFIDRDYSYLYIRGFKFNLYLMYLNYICLLKILNYYLYFRIIKN